MEVSINTSQTVNLGQWQRSVSSVWGLQFRYVICFKIWAWVPWTHFPVHYWSHGFSFFSSLQGGRSPGCGKESSRICLCPQAFHLKFWDEGHSLDQIWCSLKEKKKKKKILNLGQSFVNKTHPGFWPFLVHQSLNSGLLHGNCHQRTEAREQLWCCCHHLLRRGQWPGEMCFWPPKLEFQKHLYRWLLSSVTCLFTQQIFVKFYFVSQASLVAQW